MQMLKLAKSFPIFFLSGKLAVFIWASCTLLHYIIYKNRVKLATFKISYTSTGENSEN